MVKLSTGRARALGHLLFAALTVPGLGVAAGHESDDASARRQAMYEWYTDDYSHHGEPGFTNQKPMYFPAEYQRFLNEAAQRERRRYGALLPGSGALKPTINSPQGTLATGTWFNIGPNNANFLENGPFTLNVTDSGRANVIIVDPNNTDIIYVGFSGGGVWKTTDGGSNWTAKTETLGSLSVGTLEMDPSNSSTLYLGLGDPFDGGTGLGLVKSTDGGDTWGNVVYLGDSSIIADIEVAHSNPQIVLAATNTGLYRSINGGTSFTKVTINTGQVADPFVWTLAWGGSDTFVLGLEAAFANLGTGTTSDGQVWRSTDNGATWTRSAGITDSYGIGRLYIAAAASNRNTMYAEAANPASDLANLFKSTNNGVTWTGIGKAKQYTNTNAEAISLDTILNGQGWYNQLVLVDPTNANVAYFGGAFLLAKTSDGGASFSQVSNWLAQFSLPYVHADFHGGTITAGGTLYVGTDGGIFRSTDAGASFTDTLNKGIASHLVYQVGSSTNNISAAIVGEQDNGTRVRVGSTAVFNQIIGGDGFGCDINRADATKMLGSLYYDRIYKSTDSGTTFDYACDGIDECNDPTNAPFGTVLSRWAGDATGNTLFTFSYTKAYKSTNYATYWTALGTTNLPASGLFIRGIGVAKSSVNTVGLVANSGRAYLTIDGANWTQIGSTVSIPGNGLTLSSIAFDPTNASIIYIASVAPSLTANHLWRSSNSGTIWTAIDSAASGFPFGIPVNALIVDPVTPTTLYAATHFGVYASEDSGSHWTRWGSGMPLVNVTDISNDDGLIRAATFGRSAWELSARRYVKFDATGANNGMSWANAYTNLQSALGDSVNEIWVARGVYKPTAASDRSIAFNVPPHVRVYGGFAGTETLLAQRDVAAHLTVLSGDVDNNDTGTNGVDADTSKIVGGNSYHVVVIDGTTAAGPVGGGTTLDGFTITGGKADDALSAGGGLYCNGSGGECSPRLSNMVFSGNLAAASGGALYNGGAGGISSPPITNSTFSGNAAANGGAIYNDGSSDGTSKPSIANATFSDNSASSCGGAIYDDASSFGTSSPIIRSATFSGNSADSGNGDGSAICDFTATGSNATVLTNAIVWSNTSPEISTYNGGMTLNHVVLQENACPVGALCSTAPIGTDPHLGTLQDNGGFTPTMMPGAGSSAIGTGLDSACVGAPVNAIDQRGVARPLGAHCDIGAVEATKLSLSVSDGAAFAIYGKTLQYVVTLQNMSAADTVTGVHVSGFGSAALDGPNMLWFCTVGNCTTTQTNGSFADTATLPPNSSLTWLVNIPVLQDSNEVAATMRVRSTGATAVGDTDTLAIFRGGFE